MSNVYYKMNLLNGYNPEKSSAQPTNNTPYKDVIPEQPKVSEEYAKIFSGIDFAKIKLER